MTIDAIMPGARVLCAVSGGVDSMYLLHRMTALGACAWAMIKSKMLPQEHVWPNWATGQKSANLLVKKH